MGSQVLIKHHCNLRFQFTKTFPGLSLTRRCFCLFAAADIIVMKVQSHRHVSHVIINRAMPLELQSRSYFVWISSHFQPWWRYIWWVTCAQIDWRCLKFCGYIFFNYSGSRGARWRCCKTNQPVIVCTNE